MPGKYCMVIDYRHIVAAAILREFNRRGQPRVAHNLMKETAHQLDGFDKAMIKFLVEYLDNK